MTKREREVFEALREALLDTLLYHDADPNKLRAALAKAEVLEVKDE